MTSPNDFTTVQRGFARAQLVVSGLARTMGRWAVAQSWGRLVVLALLALIAQGIIGDMFLRGGHPKTEVIHKHAKAHTPAHINIKNDDGGNEDVHIGWDGITVHKGSATTNPPSAGTDTGAGSAAGAASGGSATDGAAPTPAARQVTGADIHIGPDGVSIVPSNGTVANSAKAAGEGPPASAGATATPSGNPPPVPPTARPQAAAGTPAATTDDEDSDASSDASDKEDSDSEIHVIRNQGLGDWLSDFLEGTVLLLIVFLIAAKIVMREAAKSDARAAEAEASAARAEASAAAASATAEREALERQLAQAQLQALQAQVEPHFLFNTLASVDYLIETDPARASAMQKNLIQYLRAALPQMRGDGSQLGREVDLARAFLEILRMRMEERLTVVIDVPDGLRSADFPPMMLQSLVENAIQHGVEPKPEGGEVRVTAAVVDGLLEVSVSDTGVGLAGAGGAPSAGGGVGLGNVRERLARLYAGKAEFSLEARTPVGVIARIRLPYVARRSGTGAAPVDGGPSFATA